MEVPGFGRPTLAEGELEMAEHNTFEPGDIKLLSGDPLREAKLTFKD